ncbi:MAG: hypothetical protein GY861_18570 [bacterium]|nr:hypothetical protein [bacterium]
MGELRPYKIGAGPEQQERIDYAWDNYRDHKFIYMIEAENGEWSTNRRSNASYFRNGKEYWDFGICQISDFYHPHIVQDRRFKEWKWQIDQCWKLYKGGTTFYGMNHIWRSKQNFEWIATI